MSEIRATIDLNLTGKVAGVTLIDMEVKVVEHLLRQTLSLLKVSPKALVALTLVLENSY